MALNGVTSGGKEFDGFAHFVEHPLSGLYDITHGEGLAVLIPAWMDRVLDGRTAPRLARYARAVWEVADPDDFRAAREGIARTRAFFASLGLPSRLTQLGVGAESFDRVIDAAVDADGCVGAFARLDRAAVRGILEAAL